MVEDTSVDESFDLVFGVHGMPDVVLIGKTGQDHLQPILLHDLDYFLG